MCRGGDILFICFPFNSGWRRRRATWGRQAPRLQRLTLDSAKIQVSQSSSIFSCLFLSLSNEFLFYRCTHTKETFQYRNAVSTAHFTSYENLEDRASSRCVMPVQLCVSFPLFFFLLFFALCSTFVFQVYNPNTPTHGKWRIIYQ